VAFGSALNKDSKVMKRLLDLPAARSSSWGNVTAPPEKLVGIVISEGGSRFARVKAVLEHAGFIVLHFPAIFVRPRPPCKGYEGLRLAMRNAWRTIVEMKTSVTVFEDDVVIHKMFDTHSQQSILREISSFKADSRARGAEVAYLGYMTTGLVKWGCHALWITPQAAEYLLNDTRTCYTMKGDSQDSNIVSACRRRHLACTYAHPRMQQAMHFGGRASSFGYFVQDRLDVASYLHAAENNAEKSASVRLKGVW